MGGCLASPIDQRVLSDEQQPLSYCTVLFGDTGGAMNVASNDVVNDRSKKIAVKYFSSKGKVQEDTFIFN